MRRFGDHLAADYRLVHGSKQEARALRTGWQQILEPPGVRSSHSFTDISFRELSKRAVYLELKRREKWTFSPGRMRGK